MIKRFTFFLLTILCIHLTVRGQNLHDNPFGDSTVRVVKVFPNPATSQINIQLRENNDQQYQFVVFNFMGKEFDNIKVSGRYQLSLDKYTSGIYIYQLRDLQGTVVESGKFNVIK
jgi:hypothetical protein